MSAVYLDSSALLKRVVDEEESDALELALAEHVAQGTTLISSSLAWVEVSRALRGGLHQLHPADEIHDWVDIAMSGVWERPITAEVVGLARRIGPDALRSLDAIHLSSAILVSADVVIAFDDRLTEACRLNGMMVVSPGR